MKKYSLKHLLESENLAEELEEISGASAAGAYNTPFAFSKNKKGNVKAAESEGYTLAKNDNRNQIKYESTSKLIEGRSRYLNFKESETYKKPSAKISFCIREIKKMIKEVNYLTKIGTKLKEETNSTPDLYWKRSLQDLQEFDSLIEELKRNLVSFRK